MKIILILLCFIFLGCANETKTSSIKTPDGDCQFLRYDYDSLQNPIEVNLCTIGLQLCEVSKNTVTNEVLINCDLDYDNQ
jgi:hypothetical protein